MVTSVTLLTLAVAALCGWVIPALTDLVTRADAPTRLKTLLASALAGLAGAMSTVVFTPHEHWQTYVFAIAVAFVNTQSAHRTLKGLGDPVQRGTSNVGVGGRRRNDAGQVSLLAVLAALVILALLFGGITVHALWFVAVALAVLWLLAVAL